MSDDAITEADAVLLRRVAEDGVKMLHGIRLDALADKLDRLRARQAEPRPDFERMLGIAHDRLDLTWTAIVESWEVTSTDGPLAGLESLADYMNGCDAVDEESIAAFEQARAALIRTEETS